MQKGIICGLTNEVADFQDTCPNFKMDEKASSVLHYKKDFNPNQTTSDGYPAWRVVLSVIIALIAIVRLVATCHKIDRNNSYSNTQRYEQNKQSEYFLELQRQKQERARKIARIYTQLPSVVEEYNQHHNSNQRITEKDVLNTLINRENKEYKSQNELKTYNFHSGIQMKLGYSQVLYDGDLPQIVTFGSNYIMYIEVEKAKGDIYQQWEKFQYRKLKDFIVENSFHYTNKINKKYFKKTDYVLNDYNFQVDDIMFQGAALLIEVENKRYFFNIIGFNDESSSTKKRGSLNRMIQIKDF